MCGLTGLITAFSNGFNEAQIDVNWNAMFLNQLRGNSSTGMVNVYKDGGYESHKVVGGWGAFTMDHHYKAFIASIRQKGKIVFGHGRSPTRGAVTFANAHPFEVENPKKKDNTVVLVHNGTLQTWQPNLDGINKHDVDSEWLAQMILQHGPEHALGNVRGAVATMWWNHEEGTFYCYRNLERPLFYVEFEEHTLINSEPSSLMWLRHKFNLPFEVKDVKEFKERSLYWKPIGKANEGFSVKSIKEVPNKEYHSKRHNKWNNDNDADLELLWGRAVETSRAVIPLKGPPGSVISSSSSEPPVRGLEEDIQYIADGVIREVAWNFGLPGRWTDFYNGTFSRNGDIKPYKLFLTRIARDIGDPEKVNLYFKDGGTQWHETRYPKITTNTDEVAEAMIETAAVPVLVKRNGARFLVGRKAKFHTRGEKEKTTIKHTVLVNARNATLFDVYENSLDGKIKVGDKVNIEIAEVDKVEGGYLRATCYRLLPVQDRCIDFFFLTQVYSEVQLYEQGNYQAVIHSIRLRPDGVETKGVVEVWVRDVVPLHIEKLDSVTPGTVKSALTTPTQH